MPPKAVKKRGPKESERPMSDPRNVSPVNPLPPVVVALFLILLGIELVFQAGARGLAGGPEAVGWRVTALQQYAFSGDILAWMWETGRWSSEHLIRLVSYPFVHGSFTQMLIAGVFLLALGKMVAESFGPWPMLAIFFGSAIGAAVVYTVAVPGPAVLAGAFPPIYGLIGAFTWLLWRRLSMVGANQARAFTMIAVLMGMQLLFGLIAGGSSDWIADLAGFGCGFALSFVVSPGGWTRLLGRMRQDD